MDTVRYTTLLKEYFRIANSLTEWITEEDVPKTREQLDYQIDVLIHHLHCMKAVNALTYEASPLSTFTLDVLNLN